MVSVESSAPTPITKVLQLISGLQQHISEDGKRATEILGGVTSWCSRRAVSLQHELQEDKTERENLEGTISKERSDIQVQSMEVEEESDDIAHSVADLTRASKLHEEEKGDFREKMVELHDILDAVKRAQEAIKKEAQKGGAFMLQLDKVATFAQALDVLVQASLCSLQDASKLTELIQTTQPEDTDDTLDSVDGFSSMTAPAVSAYASHSQGILSLLKDLEQKTQAQIDELQLKALTAEKNFEVMKMALEREIKSSGSDVAHAKKSKASSKEEKSMAKGELAATLAELDAEVHTLDDLHRACLEKASSFETSSRNRNEEMKALQEAKRVIEEETGGAEQIAHSVDNDDDDDDSFVQVSARTLISRRATRSQITTQALHIVRALARRHRSRPLSRLASRISSEFQTSGGQNEQPFIKVAGMITAMLRELEDAATSDADHKQYCDQELAMGNEKRTNWQDNIDKVHVTLDRMRAKSSKLKYRIAASQTSMSEIAASQAEMDTIRRKEHAEFLEEKDQLEQGQKGIQVAVRVLKDYYGKGDQHRQDAVSIESIFRHLELIESDFSKGLAGIIANEEAAATHYDTETTENEREKVAHQNAIKLDTREAKYVDKQIADASGDHAGLENQLAATNEYLEKIKDTCIEKTPSYEKRKEQREAEIRGLKDALESLVTETSLVQRSTRHVLRGSHKRWLK